MHLSAILLAILISLFSLAQAISNALGTSTHEFPILKVRKELYLPSPPSLPPRINPSAPPGADRSSPLLSQYWQRILARSRDHTGGPLIDATMREGRPQPRFASESAVDSYIGLTRLLRVRPQPHSPPDSHFKPRASKYKDPSPPQTTPSRTPSHTDPANTPFYAPCVLRPPFSSRTSLPSRITLQPATSVDQECWRHPGPFQQNVLAPRIDNPQVPSFLREQNSPPAAGRDHTPLTPYRAHHGAGWSLNPNPIPSGVLAFTPIDHAATEFPLLHSRSAKPWTSMANVPVLAPAPAEHVPLSRINSPTAPDTLRQRYSSPAPSAVSQDHAPLLPPRIYHPANRLPNPNALPSSNPIDASAAEYPLLHARSPKNFVLTSPRTTSTAITQEPAPIPSSPLAPQYPYIPPQSPGESPPQHSHSRSRSSGSSSSHGSLSSSTLSDSQSEARSNGASRRGGSIGTDSTQVFNVITCLPHPRQGVRCEQHCECDRHLTVNCSRYMRRCPRLCHCTYGEG